MQDTDLTPDPENQSADASFVAAAAHMFRGQQLHPCDIHRQFAVQAMGNKLLSGRAQLAAGGAYDGMFVDVIVLLWLCSSERREVLNAIRNPEDALARALDWAEEQQLGIGSPDFPTACEIYAEILVEIQKNQFRVEEKEGTSPKK